MNARYIPFWVALAVSVSPLAMAQGAMDHSAHGMSHGAENAPQGWHVMPMGSVPLRVGKPAQVILMLMDGQHGMVGEDRLKTVHTKKLHGLLLDASLTHYHHVHPEAMGEAGMYRFTFTPEATGYRFYANITDKATGAEMYLPTTLGKEEATPVPAVKQTTQATVDGYHFTWNADALRAGSATMVSIEVKDAKGVPVKALEPVLGAYAHMVGFSADRKTVVHVHPMGEEPKTDTERSGPVIRFHVAPEHAGDMKFFLQVKIAGKDIFVPFGQKWPQPSRRTSV